MNWDYLTINVQANGSSGIETTTSFSWFVIPAIVIVAIIVLVILASLIVKFYMLTRKTSLDWEQLEELMVKSQLSNEEASFLRRNLRKQGYSQPTDVLRKEIEFDKFTKKVLRRPNHHHEFLLQMIRKKTFTGHLNAVKKTTSKKTVAESISSEATKSESA